MPAASLKGKNIGHKPYTTIKSNYMEIKSLAGIDFDTIFEGFSQAFAEYELQQDRTQFRKMLQRRGFNPELSFAAFEGNRIVAFTFNGIGNYKGIPTAYDTGTGTLKEYRGKGLATKIFEHSVPYLKEANLGQYLLEVLQHNPKAISVYRNLGFEVTREFDYFMQVKERVANWVANPDPSYSVKQIDISEYASIPEFWDFQPSWQNSLESVKRAAGDLVGLGVFTGNQLIGYCVFEPASGDITQIAVDKNHRRKGVGSLLFQKIMQFDQSNLIKIINTDISCETLINFLKTKNIHMKGRQFEMVKAL